MRLLAHAVEQEGKRARGAGSFENYVPTGEVVVVRFSVTANKDYLARPLKLP